MPCPFKWVQVRGMFGSVLQVKTCLEHGARWTAGDRCPTATYRARVDAMPDCATCGQKVVQSQNARRAKADGSQSWRHLSTFQVHGPDGHRAQPRV